MISGSSFGFGVGVGDAAGSFASVGIYQADERAGGVGVGVSLGLFRPDWAEMHTAAAIRINVEVNAFIEPTI